MKKISVKTAKALMKQKEDNVYRKTFQIDGNDVEFEMLCELSMEDRVRFVRRVVSSCYDSLGNYRPEYYMPVFRATVLQMCTNLPAISLKGEHSDDGGDALDLDSMNALYEVVTRGDDWFSSAAAGFVYMLNGVCDEAIEYRNRKSEDPYGDFANLIQSARGLIQKFSDKADAVDMDELVEYAKKLSDSTEKLGDENIVKSMFEVYKNE